MAAQEEQNVDVFDGNFIPVEVLMPVSTLIEMGYTTVKRQDLLKLRGLLKTTVSEIDRIIGEPNIEKTTDTPRLWGSERYSFREPTEKELTTIERESNLIYD